MNTFISSNSLLGDTVSLCGPLGKTFALLVPLPARKDQPACFLASTKQVLLNPEDKDFRLVLSLCVC
jgi:hypothetical protein